MEPHHRFGNDLCGADFERGQWYTAFFLFFFKKNMVLTRGKPYLGLDSSGNAHPPGRGATVVIGGSGGYLEGYFWRDQHFCQCSFFRALPTYSDGKLHIPVHVLVLENVHAYSPTEAVTRRRSHHRYVSIEVGPSQVDRGAHQQALITARPLLPLVATCSEPVYCSHYS